MSDSEAPASDPLAAFLSGKRASPRHAVAMDATLVGSEARIPVRVVDLSIGGSLFEVREADLPGLDPEDPMRHIGAIERHFRDGFDLQMLESGVVVEAEIVRLSPSPTESGTVFIGCRFRQPLLPRQQRELGIAAEGSAVEELGCGEALAAASLPWAPGPGSPRALLVFGSGSNRAGPRYVAEIEGLGVRELLVRIPGANLAEVGSELYDADTPWLRLKVKGKALWQSAARLLTARYVESDRSSVQVLFEVDDPPPRALRRRYRKQIAQPEARR